VIFEKRTGAEKSGLPNSGRFRQRLIIEGKRDPVTGSRARRESITSVVAEIKEEARN
jgi:hypothetical protein